MKKISLIPVIVIMAIILSACGNGPKEQKIVEDVRDRLASWLSENETISKVEITDTYTHENTNSIDVYCKVESDNGEVAYESHYVAVYNKYDKSGWVLDELQEDVSQRASIPLKGVKESDLTRALAGRYITVDGEDWKITADNIKSISIDEQNTNLKAKTDQVVVALIIDDEVEEAEGELKINYIFDDRWNAESISGDETFTAAVKPEKALENTNENLIAAMSGQSFVLEEQKSEGIVFTSASKVAMHTVTIDSSEISDFVVEDREIVSRGTQQTYHCQCILSKPHVTFNLEIEIPYQYVSGEWILQQITISPQCTVLDIIGDWTGSYYDVPYGGTVVLSISDVDEQGNIEAVYSYSPSEQRFNKPGSYYVSGKIDMSTLDIKLTAGNWINDSGSGLSKTDISATLCVDEATIKGTGHKYNTFDVTQ